AQSLLGTYPLPFKEDLYFGKLDWLIGENHYFELIGKYRNEDDVAGIGGENTQPYRSVRNQEEKRGDFRYQYTNDRLINDMHITYESAFYNPQAAEDGIGYGLRYFPVGGNAETILNYGAGRDWQRKGQEGW